MSLSNESVHDLITKSAALVEESILVEKQAADLTVKVATLTKQAADATTKVTDLEKKASDFTAQVRVEAQKLADSLESRGFQVNKVAFVDSLVKNPIEMFAVIEKVASQATAPQLGAGDPASDGSAADPFVSWAMGTR